MKKRILDPRPKAVTSLMDDFLTLIHLRINVFFFSQDIRLNSTMITFMATMLKDAHRLAAKTALVTNFFIIF
jgi:hypothetical protein